MIYTKNIYCLSLLASLLLFLRLDTTEVYAWVPALRNNLPLTVAKTHRRNAVTTIFSTIEDSTETSIESSIATTQRERITIPMPKIQYTVPGMKRGWKENGIWMDEDGPRNGPPQNFWRQMGDERLYNTNIDLIQDLLKLNDFEANGIGNATSGSYEYENKVGDIIQNDMLNGMVDRLEMTNSIRIPTLNRLILGDWAPVVRGGKVVATSSTSNEKSANFPYRFHIQRTAGQKLAPKTNYGTFDEHLEPGEEIMVQELSNSNVVSAAGVLEVSSDKSENKLVNGDRKSVV